MPSIRSRAPVALFAIAIVATACTGGAPVRRAGPSSTPTPTATNPSVAPSARPPHPVSLPALMQHAYDGRAFRVGSVLARAGEYTRYHITYRSGDLTISGVMNVPAGRGPFPVLVLSHGYIDPAIYVNGQGLRREQDYLARNGYVVVHTDYRGHAQSDDDPGSDVRLRLGYTEDVLNVIIALRRSSLRFLDLNRVGLLGRSMGGGVALNAAVVRPGLIDAVVLYAPVSSSYADNFNRWLRQRRSLARRILARYGSPSANPEFWANVSAVTFFDRIRVPILLHHGTSDDSVPIAWSQRTVTALRRADKTVRYLVYDGEEHEFGPQWPRSIRRTLAFFDANLD